MYEYVCVYTGPPGVLSSAIAAGYMHFIYMFTYSNIYICMYLYIYVYIDIYI